MDRVVVYIDGFNLYHAIHDLNQPHLKWLNLLALGKLLVRAKTQRLEAVNYFSAFANHFQNTPDEPKLRRHRAYVLALEAKGVRCQMGNFAKRNWWFKAKNYRARWRRHEEKQTDVAIGVHLMRDAFLDQFDRALIVSCDADLIPAFAAVKAEFPSKELITVAPPQRPHHRDLLRVADDHLVIKVSQLERALFGRRVVKNGKCVAYRPTSYRPPV
jgi:uncharacterized LabA/DUF88 family protein